MNPPYFSTIALLATMLTLPSAWAAEVFWTNVNDGSFHDPINWSSTDVPEAGDDLVFTGLGAYTVTFNESATHNSARILRGDVTFDFDITAPSEDPLGDVFRVTKTGTDLPNGVSLRVGGTDVDSPAPRLTITGGTVWTVTTGVSGPRGYSPSVLRIDGPDALLQATGSGVFTTIGSAGDGRLEIINGGTVLSNSVLVGTGTGLVGGHGSILISGEGSSWTANAFNFASFSNSIDRNSASMVIEKGGFLSVALVDNREFGATLITGHDSHWENRGGFVYRAGSVDIEDGGWLSGSEMRLGYSNVSGLTSHASARVSGVDAEGVASRMSGTMLILGWAVNGRIARGLLEVANGGNATFSQNVSLGRQEANSLGILTVSGEGSALHVTGTGTSHGIFVGGSSASAQGRGFVTVTDSGVISTGSANGMRLYADGHLSGNGIVEGHVENHGTVAPSMRYDLVRPTPDTKNLTLTETRGPASTLTIDGDYTQTATGRLDLLLGHQSDHLTVSGNVALGGHLNLSLAEGYTVPAHARFSVVTAGGGLSGSFENVAPGERAASFTEADLFANYHGGTHAGVTLFALANPTGLTTAPAEPLAPSGLGAFASGTRTHRETVITTNNGAGVATDTTTSLFTLYGMEWNGQTTTPSAEANFPGEEASAYAATSEAVGLNRAVVQTNTTNSEFLAPLAFVESTWFDSFLVTGGEGTDTLQMIFRLDGMMATAEGSILNFVTRVFDMSAEITNLTPEIALAVVFDWQTYGGAEGFDEVVVANIPFVYGTPFLLESSLVLTAFDNGAVDFSGTARVLGFIVPEGSTLYSAAVTNGEDAAVYNFQAIPEPRTYALFGGLLAFAVVLIRRATGVRPPNHNGPPASYD